MKNCNIRSALRMRINEWRLIQTAARENSCLFVGIRDKHSRKFAGFYSREWVFLICCFYENFFFFFKKKSFVVWMILFAYLLEKRDFYYLKILNNKKKWQISKFNKELFLFLNWLRKHFRYLGGDIVKKKKKKSIYLFLFFTVIK